MSLDLRNLIARASTADLYDLAALTLTLLDERGQQLVAGNVAAPPYLEGVLAELRRDPNRGCWIAAYYDEGSAELAVADHRPVTP